MADKQQGAANDRLRPPTAETLVMVDWGGVAARKPLDGMAVGCMAGNRSMLTRHGMRLSTAARRGGKHHETTDNGGVGAGSRVVEGSRRAAGSTNQRPGGRLGAQCTRPRSAAAMEAALGGLSLHWHTTAGGLDCAPSVCVCVCVCVCECECVCVWVGEGVCAPCYTTSRLLAAM